MYRPQPTIVDDPAVLHAAMCARRFATIAAVVDGELRLAYAPVLVDSLPAPLGGLRFHLARANPLSAIEGKPVRLSFLCADTYISPDWYETRELVPTWNYIAIEARGVARETNEGELKDLLADLSAREESLLAPKKPWTLAKLPAERLRILLGAIRGFIVDCESLEGKFKLSQEKRQGDFEGAIAGLEARGDAASLAIAEEMRRARG